jgi:lipid-A-disaccharide synthase
VLIGFVAGEASGDLLAAPVIAALRERLPGVRCAGIAGDRMIEAGRRARGGTCANCRCAAMPRCCASCRGCWLRAALRARLLAEQPAVVVGVDSPDFNLRLEMQMRAAGCRPFTTSVRRSGPGGRSESRRSGAPPTACCWCFRSSSRSTTTPALPPPTSAIRWPRSSRCRPMRRGPRATGLPAGGPVIALLPGSRRAEVQYIGPAFVEAAALMLAREPRLRFVLPVAEPRLREYLAPALLAAGEAAGRIELVDGRSHDCLQAADGVLVASGTATLEAALFGKPMVIAYRMPATSYWIMRRMGTLTLRRTAEHPCRRSAGAGTVAGRGHAAASGRLPACAPRRRPALQRLRERFAAMHESLRRDTPRLAAEAIMATIRR